MREKLEKTTERWQAPRNSSIAVYSAFEKPKKKLGLIPAEAYFRATDKKIIGKTKDTLITMDNEYINISDIKDIYKEKRN